MSVNTHHNPLSLEENDLNEAQNMFAQWAKQEDSEDTEETEEMVCLLFVVCHAY
jgi:hypothetical protein